MRTLLILLALVAATALVWFAALEPPGSEQGDLDPAAARERPGLDWTPAPSETADGSRSTGAARVHRDPEAGEPAPSGTPVFALVGRVVDTDDAPVANALVQVHRGQRGMGLLEFVRRLTSPPAHLAEARTDRDGRFRFEALPRENVYLRVSSDHHATTDERMLWLEEAHRGAREVLVRLTAGRAVRLRLEAADGAPIAGARLLLLPEIVTADGQGLPLPLEVVTDSAGSVERANLPYAVFTVARPLGAASGVSWNQAIKLPETTDVTLTMPALSRLTGSVRDPEGQPIAGAEVTLLLNAGTQRGGYAVLTTDAQGRFEHAGLPSERIDFGQVHCEGFRSRRLGQSDWRRRDASDDRPFALEITLEPAGPLRGRLVDALSGEPIAAAHLRFVPEDSLLTLNASTATSDAQGRFTLHPDTEQRGFLEVDAEGYWSPRIPGLGEVFQADWKSVWGDLLLDVRAVPASEERVIRLAPCARVRGRVVDPGDLGIAGALVRPATPRSVLAGRALATSAGDGVFDLRDVAPGIELVLEASAPGYVPLPGEPFVLRPGEVREGVLVRAAPVAALVVRAFGANAERLAGVALELGERGGERRAVTDEQGLARFDRLAAGTYVLTARRAGHLRQRLEGLAIEGGTTRDLELLLEPAFPIRGIVVDERGAPIANARVSASGGVHHPLADTDAEGRFVLEELPRGTFAVHARHPAFLERPPVSVLAGGPPVRLELQRGATIRGRVVDEDGAPVIARLTTRIERGEVAATSGSDGWFELVGLPAGSRDLTVAPKPEPPWLKRRVVRDVAAGTDDLVILVRAGRPIHGAIVEAETTREARRIAIHGEDGERVGFCWPDPHGAFHTHGLEDGLYWLRIEAGGTSRSAWVRAAAGDENVPLHVLPLETLSGTVSDPQGAPLPGARVFVQPAVGPRDPALHPFGHTDAQGRFVLRELPAGSWDVRVHGRMRTADGRETSVHGERRGVAAGTTDLAIVVREG